jgi:Predicted nucleoside-diphosphate-sugar epimerases
VNKILVAGATGYLGMHIVKNLVDRGLHTTALVRTPSKFKDLNLPVSLLKAEVTNPLSLENCCDGIDVVISTLGITKQTDGLSYMDVDFQANLNLLNEAKRGGVKKFIYISVLHGEELKALQICKAKEKFVEELKKSGLDYCIIRPSGFFSDITEFYNMAEKGRIYLFGNGQLKSNPIHGDDLAKVCIDSINGDTKEVEVGGPEILSQIDIAKIAFEAVNKPLKITFIPDWIRRVILRTSKLLLSTSKYGPIEFFMNVMVIEMSAPMYGKQTLKDYFLSLNNERSI